MRPHSKPTELDNFYSHPHYRQIQMPTMNNKQNPLFKKGADRPLSPNKLMATRKPMINASPILSPRNGEEGAFLGRTKVFSRNGMAGGHGQTMVMNCANPNHLNKKAEYNIEVDGQQMLYCGVCAAHAASQGFTVTKLVNIKKGRPSRRVLPNIPSLKQSKIYQEILILLREIHGLQSQTKDKMGRLEGLEQQFDTQCALIDEFYKSLLTMISQLRQDHLASMQITKIRNNKQAINELQQLQFNLQQIDQMRQDLEVNIETISLYCDEHTFKQNVSKYRQRLSGYQQDVHDCNVVLKHVSTYRENDLRRSLEQLEVQVKKMWEQPKMVKVCSEQSGMSIRQVHEMLPKNVVEDDGKTAFRSLFPNELLETGIPQASPQFKMI